MSHGSRSTHRVRSPDPDWHRSPCSPTTACANRTITIAGAVLPSRNLPQDDLIALHAARYRAPFGDSGQLVHRIACGPRGATSVYLTATGMPPGADYQRGQRTDHWHAIRRGPVYDLRHRARRAGATATGSFPLEVFAPGQGASIDFSVSFRTRSRVFLTHRASRSTLPAAIPSEVRA